jgi:hypothetical protein
MSHNTALLLSGFNGVAYFFSSLVPIWVIDRYAALVPIISYISLMKRRLGRRKLMMFAVVGQGCCMAILAGTVWNGGHAAGLVATVMLFLFNFFFAVGLLAIPWLCMCCIKKIFLCSGMSANIDLRQCPQNIRP